MKKNAQKYVNPERQALSEQKEKLRESKKNWNKSVKDFIPELIKFKKLINGHVEGKDRIRLYEEFPEDSLSRLENLIEDFNQKTHGATNIINYQNAYSKNYNKFYSELEQKRKNKLNNNRPSNDVVPNKETAKAANIDLLNKINKYSEFEEYALLAEASVSAFQMGLLNLKDKWPFLEKKEKIKIKSIQRLYKLDRKFSNFENEILKSPKQLSHKDLKPLFIDILSETESVKFLIENDLNNQADADQPIAESQSATNQRDKSSKPPSSSSVPGKILSDVETFSTLATLINEKLKPNNIDFSNLNNEKNKIVLLAASIQSEGSFSPSQIDSLIESYKKLIKDFTSLVSPKINLKIVSSAHFNFFKINYNNLYNPYNNKSPGDVNNVYDPIYMKTKKGLKAYLSLSDLDAKDIYDWARENRMQLENMMDAFKNNAVENFSDIKNNFEIIENNNSKIRGKMNALRPEISDPKQLERAERSLSLRNIRNLFKKENK